MSRAPERNKNLVALCVGLKRPAILIYLIDDGYAARHVEICACLDFSLLVGLFERHSLRT